MKNQLTALNVAAGALGLVFGIMSLSFGLSVALSLAAAGALSTVFGILSLCMGVMCFAFTIAQHL